MINYNYENVRESIDIPKYNQKKDWKLISHGFKN